MEVVGFHSITNDILKLILEYLSWGLFYDISLPEYTYVNRFLDVFLTCKRIYSLKEIAFGYLFEVLIQFVRDCSVLARCCKIAANFLQENPNVQIKTPTLEVSNCIRCGNDAFVTRITVSYFDRCNCSYARMIKKFDVDAYCYICYFKEPSSSDTIPPKYTDIFHFYSEQRKRLFIKPSYNREYSVAVFHNYKYALLHTTDYILRAYGVLN
jgi:hypothetical protein